MDDVLLEIAGVESADEFQALSREERTEAFEEYMGTDAFREKATTLELDPGETGELSNGAKVERTEDGFIIHQPRTLCFSMSDSETERKGVALGVTVGLALGAGVGVAIDNIGLGMGTGMAIGVALGVVWDQKES